ncbi:MAG: DUF4330 domain-containing protein [Oscillospiraceae bacterium]|nr:DUF4330 domain-containing protein [Oscillospiraceae bacterium]
MKQNKIDETGRLFGKINVIDLGILLLVVFIAIGAFLKFAVLEQTTVTIEAAPVSYTLEITNVRDWTIRNIRVGDTLYVTGTAVGTVVGIETRPHRVAVSSNDGAVWWGDVPERYVVEVEVEGTATVSDGRFLVSRTVPLSAGTSTTVFTTRYAGFEAMVKEIALYGDE